MILFGQQQERYIGFVRRHTSKEQGEANMLPGSSYYRCWNSSPEPPPPPRRKLPTNCEGKRKRAGAGATLAGACSLLLATAAHPATAAVEAGGLFNGGAPAAAGAACGYGGSRGASCGSGGGGCRRRGFAEYSTRGCFVLCVTPSSAKATESERRSSGRAAGGGGRLVATSSVRRTRAGAVASQPVLAGAFLNRGSLDQRGVGNGGGDGCLSLGLNRGGGGGDEVGSGGGARALECAMEDGRKGGRLRGRIRQVLNKMRGRAASPPPVAATAAGNQMMYDPGQVCVPCVCAESCQQTFLGTRLLAMYFVPSITIVFTRRASLAGYPRHQQANCPLYTRYVWETQQVSSWTRKQR